jgi:RimJ/RimL family protein N-acetyltransferase
MATELVTPRLVLDRWRDEDVTAYGEMVCERDPRGTPAPFGSNPTEQQLLDRIDTQRRSAAETGIGLLAVRVGGDFAGYCGLIIGRGSLDEPEIAYELLRAYQRKGYATEAGRAVVDAAAQTGRSRLWATVRTWNDASLRVLDKLGFGTDRQTTDEFGDLLWLTRTL